MNEHATPIDPRQGQKAEFPRLLGERLCLDFANSVESPLTEPEEFLTDLVALARWGLYVGLLNEPDVAVVARAHMSDPRIGAPLFAEAIALRSSIQATFQAIAEARDVQDDDLAIIRQSYLQGLQQSRLTLLNGPADWVWDGRGELGAVEFLLWRVAQSAVDVLMDGDLSRIKRCDCSWLFYDTSRNGSRRWCSMEGCGTQAKMRRFTERRRAARG